MLLPGWLRSVVVASSILRWLLAPLSLHFFLVFPEQSPLLRRFPRLAAEMQRELIPAIRQYRRLQASRGRALKHRTRSAIKEASSCNAGP